MLDLVLQMPPLILGILAGLILLLICVAALLFGSLYGPKAKLQKRITNVVGKPVGSVKSSKTDKGGPDRRRGVEAKLRELERLKKSKRGYRLNEELVQAGLRVSPRQFVVIACMVGLLLAALYLVSGLPRIGLPLIAIIGMLGLPKFYLRFRIKRRLKQFTALFADGIDIVVRGVRTGLTVGECLAIVGREMRDPVGSEFRQVTEGIHLGLSLEECLNKMHGRVPTTEVRFFNIVLVMQQSTGGNLAETLEKLSDIIRSRKRMRDKIQALSSEAKTSAAIVGALPVLVSLALVGVAPDYIKILVTADLGKWLIAGGLVWMSIGVFVMAKIISFDH
ncbi:type II secretion system F family protein [Dongia soli]|uniref:Type II secretion system F family protein n=1 Tax=Dongia soli TaxID=600628 RepID=A0ABU5EBP2_9PROT|nr:type II secretion system F family protein [Dongia soli]MDY0883297.1 type II secretion system F family protein [Dongia soli]